MPIRRAGLVHRSPVFYGWIILAVATVGLIMTSPGQTYAVSIFIEHFIRDLGISRSLVSTLYTGGTLLGSFALPVVGRRIDSHGARRAVVIISVLLGFGCIFMGLVRNALMLGLGFVAIRLFGQGSLSIVSTNVINQWWVRRRGAMLGIAGLFFALFGLGAFPSLINHLVATYGWRAAYILLGGLVWLVMTPLGLVFFRDRPEQFGLVPDGAVSLTDESRTGVFEVNKTLAEALRTGAFWVLALSNAVIAMLVTGLFFHMISIFADNNLAPTVAAAVYLPVAIATAATNFGSGLLVDRLAPRYLLSAALATLALSMWLVMRLTSLELALAYGVIIGITNGLARTVGSVVWAQYFGRRHLGAISGTASTITVAGTALGPMPFGIVRDLYGTFAPALNLSALLPLVLAILVLFTRRSAHQATEDNSPIALEGADTPMSYHHK